MLFSLCYIDRNDHQYHRKRNSSPALSASPISAFTFFARDLLPSYSTLEMYAYDCRDGLCWLRIYPRGSNPWSWTMFYCQCQIPAYCSAHQFPPPQRERKHNVWAIRTSRQSRRSGPSKLGNESRVLFQKICFRARLCEFEAERNEIRYPFLIDRRL